MYYLLSFRQGLLSLSYHWILVIWLFLELSMSNGSSGKGKSVVPVDSGRVASAPKFKRHKVSAIQDFLPGCGRVTAPNFGSSELITVDRFGQGKW
ncbi:hypothetical protein J1N35_022606 [Gossypium stocksii]|uniref:Uncharacterized protein n=1 Tax=Gossypium stocksii TaxID=47602 RepID=A0A9D3VGS6_9ROSI|nr:hypothetical protein J1N35_022606 [Gossypium stocksii]